MVPLPETFVHTPLPVPGALPASVAAVALQSVWSVPASAVAERELTSMVTSSEAVQVPIEMVHLKTEVPEVSPVTPEAGFAGARIVPLPETFVHIPLPVVGALPSSMVVVILQRV